jgi:hypothetical protein
VNRGVGSFILVFVSKISTNSTRQEDQREGEEDHLQHPYLSLPPRSLEANASSNQIEESRAQGLQVYWQDKVLHHWLLPMTAHRSYRLLPTHLPSHTKASLA